MQRSKFFFLLFTVQIASISGMTIDPTIFMKQGLIRNPSQSKKPRKSLDLSMFKVKGRSRKLNIIPRTKTNKRMRFDEKTRKLGIMSKVFGPSEKEKQLDADIAQLKDEITTMTMDEAVTEESKSVFTQLSYESEKMKEDIKSMSENVVESLKEGIKMIDGIPDLLANL